MLTVMGEMEARKQRASTMQRNLVAREQLVKHEVRDTASILRGANNLAFNAAAVTLSDFVKRASDYNETFTVTNNTQEHITQLKLLMRYSSTEGEVIQQREITVNVNIKPGMSGNARVRSFDRAGKYYYYYGTKPRKQGAAPFVVAVRLLQYSVAVERE